MSQRSLVSLLGATEQSGSIMRTLATVGLLPLLVVSLATAAYGVFAGDLDVARAGGLTAVVFLFVYSGTIVMYALLDVTDPRLSLAIAMGAYSAKILFVVGVVAIPGLTERVAPYPFAGLLTAGILWWIVVHVRVSWNLPSSEGGSNWPTGGTAG